MAEQLNLFRNTSKIIENVEISDELLLWVTIAGEGIFNDCLDHIVGSGLVGSDEEALDFLDNVISKKLGSSKVSYRQDVAGRRQAKGKVSSILYEQEAGQSPLDLRLGALSHDLFLNLLGGAISRGC